MEIKNHSSGLIESTAYDSIEKKLRVVFKNGAAYEYNEIDENLYNDFISQSSIGKAFHEKIRSKPSNKLITEYNDEKIRESFPANIEGSSEFNKYSIV